jgi:hypothetical protein
MEGLAMRHYRFVSTRGALLAVATILPALLAAPVPTAAAGLWGSSVPFTNAVVSRPVAGGGYPDDASGAPQPGTCGPGTFDSNHSESWLAVQPGTETLVGTSKYFFQQYSTFYNFYVGSYGIRNGASTDRVVQGYDCTTVGTQAMPPSWTNTTDPNADFDTGGRVYQTMLPFNAFWTNLHPNGEITVSFSDDLGAHWTTGNGGQALEQVPNSTSFSLHFEDKQFVAVNHFRGSPFQDHVYAVWDLGNTNGNAVAVREAVSRDRGQTFAKAQTISPPSSDQNRNAYPLPGVGPDGSVYVAYNNLGLKHQTTDDLFVVRSTDDGQTFSTPVRAATTTLIGNGAGGVALPNTTFRDGIPDGFAVSPDLPGHLYLAYNAWDGAQYDVFLVQSTDYGQTWSQPVKVNDNVDAPGGATDQFQPAVAAGPGGAVAVGFYDRRAACPTSDPAILPADQGRGNVCIDVSLQAYRDAGAGAVPVGGNYRVSRFSWDPQQPGQVRGGLPQIACASHNIPCSLSFIGDYFSIAISGANVYTFPISTHYQSGIRADDGSPIYYQQQVLGTISRSALGI